MRGSAPSQPTTHYCMGLTPTPVLPLPPEPKGAAPRSSACPPKSGQICLHSLHTLHPRYKSPQIGGRIVVFCGGNSSTGGSRGSPMKRAGPPLVGAIGIEQIRDRCLPTFCRPRPTSKRWEILGGEHPAVCTIVADVTRHAFVDTEMFIGLRRPARPEPCPSSPLALVVVVHVEQTHLVHWV